MIEVPINEHSTDAPQRAEQHTSERGAVTAEFAVALPAVIFILALLLGATATGIVQLKLEESVRVGARAAARGENTETVQRLVREIDGDFAVNIQAGGETVTVQSSAPAPGVIGDITGWTLHAESSIPREQSHVSG
ncbi:TadE family type IV pilus minor pilin [uncultured Rothia sp.]|uniref:TadE family type IV pilus minor pilin n=1 Tax=uncultured Rothia sp. TaxID=316088 RepID=UPI00321786CD